MPQLPTAGEQHLHDQQRWTSAKKFSDLQHKQRKVEAMESNVVLIKAHVAMGWLSLVRL